MRACLQNYRFIKLKVLASLFLVFSPAAWGIDLFPTFEPNCTFEMQSAVIRSIYFGLNVTNSEDFAQCLRTSNFIPCKKDPTSNIEDGIRVTRSNLPLHVNCQTVRSDTQAEANIGTLFHSGPEYVSFSSTFLNSAAADTTGVWLGIVAGTLWHETAHTHGFTHDFSSTFCTTDGVRHPSMNELIDRCVRQTAENFVRQEFASVVTDLPATRPISGEINFLSKTLANRVPQFAFNSLHNLTGLWLEGPGTELRSQSGQYLAVIDSSLPNDRRFNVPGFAEATNGSSPRLGFWHLSRMDFSRPNDGIRIHNLITSSCLRRDLSTGLVNMRACDGSPREAWSIIPTGYGAFKLRSMDNQLQCLGQTSVTVSAPSYLQDCSASGNIYSVQFRTTSLERYSFRTSDKLSCIDVPGGWADQNLALQTYGCHRQANQLWQIQPASLPLMQINDPRAKMSVFHLVSGANGLCIGSLSDGTLVQSTCSSNSLLSGQNLRQLFELRMRSLGDFEIRTPFAGDLCLTKAAGGNTLFISACSGASNQAWRLERER